ncbi:MULTISPECIES: hypothetical protein [Roseibium]|uniref:Peptidase M15 n=1 Tax=Roseibium aggregatum TaxID=187304 RepID=A0A0M6Y6I5_9HYPH|nr:hypothetical protein [Roseibium aggregatum]CTQ45314.1 hypothetical protein LAL4801_03764 [Roseibium aggregatum]
MKQPGSMKALEELGRKRLSENFYMRDFLYSEISNFFGIPNLPHYPDVAVEAGTQLCDKLLEPLRSAFGHIAIRSAYRSPEVNAFGNENGHNCASNEANYADHIWDYRDAERRLGATACVVVPWFWDRHQDEGDWQRLAWWIHDHLPYNSLWFFPRLWAVNINWRESPERRIVSYAVPKGVLTKPGMANHSGNHGEWLDGLPSFPADDAGDIR